MLINFQSPEKLSRHKFDHGKWSLDQECVLALDQIFYH